jgi:ParB-like chromosome segregation protein Spo0J
MSVIRSKHIELVNIKQLKPKTNNRNQHSKDQIEAITKVLRYQGFRSPITISNQSGEIVCGHGRYLAAKKLGFKEIPVIYQDFDTPEQEYAHHVADNSLGLRADLDFGGIHEDLADLGPDFDIEMLGLKDFEIEPADKPKKDRKCPHCGESLSRGQE